MKLSKRDRILLPVVLIGVLVLIWGLLNPPAPTGGKGKLLPLAEAERKREVALRTLKRIGADSRDIEPRIQKMAFTLPADQLEPRVIRDLQTIAERSDVHLREVKPLRPRPLTNGIGSRVPVELRFRAPFQPNVIRFLYDIEDPEGRMVVEKMTLNSADAASRTVEVTALISVFTQSGDGPANANQGETRNGNNKTDG